MARKHVNSVKLYGKNKQLVGVFKDPLFQTLIVHEILNNELPKYTQKFIKEHSLIKYEYHKEWLNDLLKNNAETKVSILQKIKNLFK